MLFNIIDHRSCPYRWARVKAVVEPSSHDKAIEEADQATAAETSLVCEDRDGLSLREAVLWAEQLKGPITLFLYDSETNKTGSA